MILAVDIGNTQTVLGLFDGDSLIADWRVSTSALVTADEIRVQLAALLAADGFAWDGIDRVVIASVVPRLTGAYEDLARKATGRPPMIIGPGIKTGMLIRYENPAEVGADRIVNAVAAVEAWGAPVIVIDFGTATTFDVIDADGAYLGGAIAPGVETSAEALFAKAARLSKVDLEPPTRAIGRTTRESVQAGLMLGEAAMVDGLVHRIRAELEVDAPVVATGGLAERMAPLCAVIDHVDMMLTLTGLRLIHDRNA